MTVKSALRVCSQRIGCIPSSLITYAQLQIHGDLRTSFYGLVKLMVVDELSHDYERPKYVLHEPIVGLNPSAYLVHKIRRPRTPLASGFELTLWPESEILAIDLMTLES